MFENGAVQSQDGAGRGTDGEGLPAPPDEEPQSDHQLEHKLCPLLLHTSLLPDMLRPLLLPPPTPSCPWSRCGCATQLPTTATRGRQRGKCLLTQRNVNKQRQRKTRQKGTVLYYTVHSLVPLVWPDYFLLKRPQTNPL